MAGLQGKFVCRAKLGIAMLSLGNIINNAIVIPHIVFFLNLYSFIMELLILIFFLTLLYNQPGAIFDFQKEQTSMES